MTPRKKLIPEEVIVKSGVTFFQNWVAELSEIKLQCLSSLCYLHRAPETEEYNEAVIGEIVTSLR